MSDQRTIVRELAAAAARGERVVLASVVRTVGSAYRGVGARMIVRADDSSAGLVSGGCLEGDLVARAKRLREGERAEVMIFDSLSEDDTVWGFGLGCNGRVEILLEPLSPERAAAVAALLGGALDGDAPVLIATVVQCDGAAAPALGARARLPLSRGFVEREGEWGSADVLERVAGDSAEVAEGARRGVMREYALEGGGVARVSFELVVPTVRLVICGSGPDAQPVARVAEGLGWSVTVVDHRPVALARPERFPGARMVECAEAALLGRAVSLKERTAAVVMSHHYGRDLDYLDALLASDVGYVGLLGPRSRRERMLAELAERGRRYSDAELDSRLFGPVGLDIGAEGPEAIALAIVAEVAAVTSGRGGGHLRDREAPIHSGA
jgi:xanthine/CO dehydrogenase XdhC/CoxF family maturation factor